MQKRRKKRKGRKAAVIIIVVLTVLLASGVTCLAMRQIGRLDRETARIAETDLTEGTVDRTVYTDGGYGEVEDAMKAYMAEYAETLQNARSILQEEKFAGLLEAENLEADGPDFRDSLAYLDEKQNAADEAFGKLEEMAEEETIMAAVEGRGLNPFFENLYRKEMLNVMQKDVMYEDDELQPARNDITDAIESRRALLEFLAEQKEHWELKNGRVNFDADGLLSRYNALAEAVG